MYDPAREELEYEFNAQFDYIREAYGDLAPDPEVEAFGDYLDACEREGENPLGFDEWRAAHAARRARPAPLGWGADADADSFCPF